MSVNQNFFFQSESYTPAELHEGKRWEIIYYAMHPQTGKLKRIAKRCNKIKSISLRRAYAKKLCAEINKKLSSGWNPFLEQQSGKGFTKLLDALQTFKAEKNKELRIDTLRSYNSYIKTFENWLIKQKESDLFCLSFTKQHAINFLSDIYMNRDVSNRTYNNYLRFFRTLFSWMVERDYCMANHFIKLSKKKSEEKQREIIPPDIRNKIADYLRKNDLPFFCMTLLCYGCFIRPKEILNLKPGNISIDKKIVQIPASVAKNGKSRIVAIPADILPELVKLGIEKINPDSYVFSENFRPGRILKNTRDIGRYWYYLRKTLNIPAKISFYSLKDTGITNMLDAGVPAKIVQHHADHSTLEMTEKYYHKNLEHYKNTISQIPVRFSDE